jgi:hypothetical protein
MQSSLEMRPRLVDRWRRRIRVVRDVHVRTGLEAMQGRHPLPLARGIIAHRGVEEGVESLPSLELLSLVPHPQERALHDAWRACGVVQLSGGLLNQAGVPIAKELLQRAIVAVAESDEHVLINGRLRSGHTDLQPGVDG